MCCPDGHQLVGSRHSGGDEGVVLLATGAVRLGLQHILGARLQLPLLLMCDARSGEAGRGADPAGLGVLEGDVTLPDVISQVSARATKVEELLHGASASVALVAVPALGVCSLGVVLADPQLSAERERCCLLLPALPDELAEQALRQPLHMDAILGCLLAPSASGHLRRLGLRTSHSDGLFLRGVEGGRVPHGVAPGARSRVLLRVILADLVTDNDGFTWLVRDIQVVVARRSGVQELAIVMLVDEDVLSLGFKAGVVRRRDAVLGDLVHVLVELHISHAPHDTG